MKLTAGFVLAVSFALAAAVPAPLINSTCITTNADLLKIDGHTYSVHCNTKSTGQPIGNPTQQENFAYCVIHCGETPNCLAAQYSDATNTCEALGAIENSQSVLGEHGAVRDFSAQRANTPVTTVPGFTIPAITARRREPPLRYCNNSSDGVPTQNPQYDQYDLRCGVNYEGGLLLTDGQFESVTIYFLYNCIDTCNRTPGCVIATMYSNICTIRNASAVPLIDGWARSAVKHTVDDCEKEDNSTVNATVSARAKRDLDYGRRKRGILYQDATKAWGFRGADSRVVWGHNWYSSVYGANCNNDAFTGGSMENGMTFIPTIWTCRDECLAGVWEGNVNNAIANYHTDSLMSFNEPDMINDVGGSALSPAEASNGWRSLMEPFAGRVALGAPATTYTSKCSEGGWQWLRDFMEFCNDCHIDFVPIHYFVDSWGNVEASVQDFQDELRCLADTFQRPIWITEMHYNAPSEGEEIYFLTSMIDFFETNDWISRYSYRRADEMVNPDGSPTHVGYCYLCYRTDGTSDSCCLNS